MDILDLANTIRISTTPLKTVSDGYDSVVKLIGESRFVLLGEATHGTKEFYRARAAITRRLLQEKDFSAVAVEADFPDAYRINRYVKNIGFDARAIDALGDFKRFPTWMWRNKEVLKFVEELRRFNSEFPVQKKKGFYGLDIYSMYSSIDAVISYLDKVDSDAAKRARERYSCFEQYGKEEDSYGFSMSYFKKDCQKEVIEELLELQSKGMDYVKNQGYLEDEEHFFAEQNAHLAKDAEAYYRESFRGRINTWNIRDHHMAETLEQLSMHLEKVTGSGKIIVWAHNSHIGDARATEFGEIGEKNLGQFIREKFSDQSIHIGFTTYDGTVSAASGWGVDVERKAIIPALHGSYEDLFRHVGDSFSLVFSDLPKDINHELNQSRLERMIGVVYTPKTERQSHYAYAHIVNQFDAIIHFTTTSALEPLEGASLWIQGEVPDTYDTGL